MSKIDDILPLPRSVEIRLIAPDVLVLRRIIPDWGNELIQIAERTEHWYQSGQVDPTGTSAYQSAYRTSNSLMITSKDPLYGPCLSRFEEALIRAFHTGVLAYKRYNEFLNVTDDSGYEMLRYQEGQGFGAHTDAVLGRSEGFRQLTGLIYLNDDYTGGETYFPRQRIKFKGEAGDLLLFPSNFCYPHESLPVTKGTKYAIVTWFLAYPKKDPEETAKEENHEDAEVVGGAAGAPADDGVRLHEPAGSGSPEGEPEAPDREHPACVGGRAESGTEA